MKKFFQFLLIILISTFLASVFGAIHNQISYTVSDEYFRNFLFALFGFFDDGFTNTRVLASIIGIIGSWWVGLLLGIVYGIIFLFINADDKFKKIINAICITLIITVIASFIGFLVGSFIPIEKVGVWMDFGTKNPQAYVSASYMHTFSYFGGIFGLVIGIIYLLKVSKNGNRELP